MSDVIVRKRTISCIDIGTNTALLLIARLDLKHGTIKPVCHRQTIVRLGQQVDASGIIQPEAIERLISCMKLYARLGNGYGVEETIAVGTSALRDATNRTEVIAEVEKESGLHISCIPGAEEADLTFIGAVAGMEEVPSHFTVIDIGGGSTEISTGSLAAPGSRISLDVGCVRLTERFFQALPPSETAYEAARRTVASVLSASLSIPEGGWGRLYGVAGTVTTIAQLDLGETSFDPDRIHTRVVDIDAVGRILEELKHQTLEGIVAMGIPPGRADVLLVGVLILHEFMHRYGIASVQASIQGLRFGLAVRELERLRAVP